MIGISSEEQDMDLGGFARESEIHLKRNTGGSIDKIKARLRLFVVSLRDALELRRNLQPGCEFQIYARRSIYVCLKHMDLEAVKREDYPL